MVSVVGRSTAVARTALVVLVSLLVTPFVGAQEETEDDLAFLAELRRDFRRGGSYSALRELDEYLLDFPRSAEGHELAAQVAFGRGRLDEALEHLDDAGDGDAGLRSRILLRQGRYEEALELARSSTLPPLRAASLEVTALDGLGRRNDARRRARDVVREVDDRTLDGRGLLELGRLLFFERRYDLANQALVFADRELNGLRGPKYELNAPEVLVLLGEVYHATRQSGQGGADRTLTLLNEVLEVDPGRADALVVKARTYVYGMNARKAEESLDRALSRDPTHPDALVLRGRMRLSARRIEPALEAADAVLERNPRHRDALALRGAALVLAGRDEDAARARATFEQHHPESAALDAGLGEVLQDYYRFAESVAPLERALVIEPENEEPLAVLAQSLAHLGREEEARAALEEHVERSPYPFPWRNNMLELLVKLEDSAEVVTDDGFRLRLPPGERGVLGRLLAERLGEAREDMGRRWGVDPEEEVLVEVFDVHGDFSVRTVGFEGFFALGACFGHVMTLVSPLSEMRGQFHWAQTAVHEYAHVVTLTMTNQRIPRWLSEGVSVVEEKRVDPAWARELERDVLDARANGLVFPVERMDEAFQDGETVLLGYYLGSLVCEVVERDFGFDGLRRFVAAYRDDRTTGEAVREALGIEASELDVRLLEYIDTEIAARAAVRPRYRERGKDELRRRVMAGDEDALVELAAAYHDVGQPVDRDTALERALDRVGETPRVLRLLAERHLFAGRVDEGREALRRWADGTDGVDADGLLLLARILLRDDEREEALGYLRRARTLYPGDVGPGGVLALLYELLDPESDREEWLDVVRAICDHDEIAVEPRLELAREAAENGDRATALRYWSEVVAIDPYAPQRRMEFAELLLEDGQLAAARRQWELVLAIRPEHLPGQETVAGPLVKLLADGLDEHQEEARRLLDEHAEGSDG